MGRNAHSVAVKGDAPVTAMPVYPVRMSLPLRWLSPIGSRWAYSRMLFLALAFPLGLAYFVSLVVGFAVGGSLAWTIPGVASLVLVVLASRWAGDLETALVKHLVGIQIRRPPTWYERDVPLREQAKQILIDPSTWLGIVYLFGRLPQGIAALVVLTVGTAVPITLILAPAIVLSPGISGVWGPFESGEGWMRVGFGGEGSPSWLIDTPAEAWAVVPLGLVGLLVSLHLFNLMGWLSGQWARLMLGSRARDIPQPPSMIQGGQPVLPAQAVQHASISSLTSREQEVLMLIARGYSNADIAETFVVSEGTVKTHVKRILSKLEVRDRTQAAVFAFDSGFVSPASASEPGRY